MSQSPSHDNSLNPSANYICHHFSIESIPAQIDKLLTFKDHFPSRMRVYLTLIELSQLPEQIEAAQKIQQAHCTPVMHLPARLIKDENTLRAIIDQYEKANIQDLLLLGGNPETPAGIFGRVSDVLKTGLFNDRGFKTISIAGHPEGNAAIEKTLLHNGENFINILKDKIYLIESLGCEAHITTQFLFDSDTLIQWAKELRRHNITVPIHPGIAGPASIKALIKYSLLCGVGASIHFLKKQALSMSRLLIDYNPDPIVEAITKEMTHNPSIKIGTPHFFVFGGFEKLFKWIKNTHTIHNI